MSARAKSRLQMMSARAKSRLQMMSARAKSRLQMRRVALRAWVLCWLILVWMLLWGTVSAANILSGLAIALLITLLLPLPVVPIEGRVHPLSLLRLIVTVAYYLVLSSIQVAWLALKPGPPPLSAVLRAHLAIKSDLVLALAVNIVNLIPGSIALEIDQVRRMIYVHVIDVDSDRAVNRFYRQVAEVERLLVSTFEREADWRPAAREAADRAC
jgi:multicomponent Na+:H+ antiporter subunit E